MRRTILEQSKRANVGHIGSCLCIVELLCAVAAVKRPAALDDPLRDRLVLSKGHAALALFALLHEQGVLSRGQMDTFCTGSTHLLVHPEVSLDGVDFSTGSLGQGVSYATGAALAAKMEGHGRRVFCVCSDAETNEGIFWEAAMFAGHHGLDRLALMVDFNGQQAFGCTRDVLNQDNLADRLRAFGWEVRQLPGHDVAALSASLNDVPEGKPLAIVAQTTFGKGVSFMEEGRPVTQTHLATQPITWHYLPLSDEEYAMAMAEVGGAA